MEDGLRASMIDGFVSKDNGLNPCSCGGWSQSIAQVLQLVDGADIRLNPCSCGGWSQRVLTLGLPNCQLFCLNPCSCGGWSQRAILLNAKVELERVLILVLVEDGLRVPFN